MPKREFPKYRCQKSKDGKPDRAFVELEGKKRYLGVYGTPQTSPESWKKYRHLRKQWYANDCRLAITTVKTGILVKELAVHYLRWAEVRYKDVPQSYAHCRAAMQLLVDHFGEESTDNFTKHSLRFLQKVLVEKGVNGKPYARPTVNRYVGIIRMAFVEGEEQGWGIADSTVTSLKLVRNLKLGKTTAREYQEGKPVPWEIVDQTLPFLPPIIRDMVRIQRLIGGRPQDVRNMRLCDIDRDSPIPEYPDVWEYRPFKHKTKYLGKELVKRIGYQAQAILLPYLLARENDPESFLFSPKDSMEMRRIELRRNRKTKVQPSQIERAKRSKVKRKKRRPGDQYSVCSYARAVAVACKRAGVPKWHPHQLRHSRATEVAKTYGDVGSQMCLGHSDINTTNGYIERDTLLAAKIAAEIG